ncbi:papilin-like [Ostrea edulis]|uniref:papilin-like n=1 Tax=Ostrea edulis TaxID=37623 RepID=UPI0024AE9034|nr:papilin-like [Ostrea edulis]
MKVEASSRRSTSTGNGVDNEYGTGTAPVITENDANNMIFSDSVTISHETTSISSGVTETDTSVDMQSSAGYSTSNEMRKVEADSLNSTTDATSVGTSALTEAISSSDQSSPTDMMTQIEITSSNLDYVKDITSKNSGIEFVYSSTPTSDTVTGESTASSVTVLSSKVTEVEDVKLSTDSSIHFQTSLQPTEDASTSAENINGETTEHDTTTLSLVTSTSDSHDWTTKQVSSAITTITTKETYSENTKTTINLNVLGSTIDDKTEVISSTLFPSTLSKESTHSLMSDHWSTTQMLTVPLLKESDLVPTQISVKHKTVSVYVDVILSGYTIMELYGFGLHMCVMECLKTTDCHSVNLLKDQKTCQLNSATSVDVGLEKRKSSVFTRKEQWPKTMLEHCKNKICRQQEQCVELHNQAACIVVNCKSPPIVANANAVDCLMHVGSQVKYNCIQGKSPNVPVASMFVTCRGNGQWTAVQFQCL